MLARASLLALSLAAAFAVGCTYHKDEGVNANGDSGQLAFAAPNATVGGLGAVGFARTITVSRYGPTTITCHGLGGSSNRDLHIQGGSLPPDHCSSRPADAITLVSAKCDDDACTVTSAADGPSIKLTVTGKTAGATRLVVSTTQTSDGTKFDDSIGLEFAVPARIAVTVSPGELPALRAPVLVGLELGWPSGSVVDATGRGIEIENNPMTHVLEGDAYESVIDAGSSEGKKLVARRAGHATLHFSLPGSIDRKVDLEVVDPASAHALFVYAAADDAVIPDVGETDLDSATADDPALAGGRITSITLDASSYLTTTFPTRAQLTDGRLALAPIAPVEIVPAGLAMTTSANAPGSIALYSGTAKQGAASVTSGSATIRVDGGGPSLTLPVKIAPKAAAPASR